MTKRSGAAQRSIVPRTRPASRKRDEDASRPRNRVSTTLVRNRRPRGLVIPSTNSGARDASQVRPRTRGVMCSSGCGRAARRAVWLRSEPSPRRQRRDHGDEYTGTRPPGFARDMPDGTVVRDLDDERLELGVAAEGRQRLPERKHFAITKHAAPRWRGSTRSPARSRSERRGPAVPRDRVIFAPCTFSTTCLRAAS